MDAIFPPIRAIPGKPAIAMLDARDALPRRVLLAAHYSIAACSRAQDAVGATHPQIRSLCHHTVRDVLVRLSCTILCAFSSVLLSGKTNP